MRAFSLPSWALTQRWREPGNVSSPSLFGAGGVVSQPSRIINLDVIRGFAVCGILVMNIVAMGEPSYAYVDPHYYGGAQGADLAAWAIAYVLADGKMRALFTMLFGASLLLITDAAEDRTPGPARVHYARMFWLFVFGM